jgi:hypothetical protein
VDRTNARDAAIVIGTLFDKQAIASGDATANVHLNFELQLRNVIEGQAKNL